MKLCRSGYKDTLPRTQSDRSKIRPKNKPLMRSQPVISERVAKKETYLLRKGCERVVIKETYLLVRVATPCLSRDVERVQRTEHYYKNARLQE